MLSDSIDAQFSDNLQKLLIDNSEAKQELNFSQSISPFYNFLKNQTKGSHNPNFIFPQVSSQGRQISTSKN